VLAALTMCLAVLGFTDAARQVIVSPAASTTHIDQAVPGVVLVPAHSDVLAPGRPPAHQTGSCAIAVLPSTTWRLATHEHRHRAVAGAARMPHHCSASSHCRAPPVHS
jgi:hypothetical protein